MVPDNNSEVVAIKAVASNCATITLWTGGVLIVQKFDTQCAQWSSSRAPTTAVTNTCCCSGDHQKQAHYRDFRGVSQLRPIINLSPEIQGFRGFFQAMKWSVPMEA